MIGALHVLHFMTSKYLATALKSSFSTHFLSCHGIPHLKHESFSHSEQEVRRLQRQPGLLMRPLQSGVEHHLRLQFFPTRTSWLIASNCFSSSVDAIGLRSSRPYRSWHPSCMQRMAIALPCCMLDSTCSLTQSLQN